MWLMSTTATTEADNGHHVMRVGRMTRQGTVESVVPESPVTQAPSHDAMLAFTRSIAGSTGHAAPMPTGHDPKSVHPDSVLRVKARVGKRVLFDGQVKDGAGALLAKLHHHGRRLHVTLWLIDGTKRVYRGNGERIR